MCISLYYLLGWFIGRKNNENIKRFLVGMGIFTIELILKIKGFYINK